MVFGDTIYAVASPPGDGVRAVLRLSGPAARAAAAAVFVPPPPSQRCCTEGVLTVLSARLPAFALSMPAPHSYTGEEVVELHVPGSPLLCAELAQAMVAAIGSGLRQARPGEFTARALEHGKLDFAQAEGVLMLIHGDSAHASALGAAWLGGGLSAAVAAIRERLRDALALVEAGLDFAPEETGSVPAAAWAAALPTVARDLAHLQQAVPAAAVGGEVLLLGRSNAGKSSLANALAGRDAALVAASPGTTRDLLRIDIGGGAAVFDAPGDLEAPGALDRRALWLRNAQGATAAALVHVVDPADPAPLPASPLPVLAVVLTKADRWAPGLAPPLPALPAVPRFVTSARTGAGVPELRRFLQAHSRRGASDAGAPLRQALGECAAAVTRAAAAQAAPELASVDLQAALHALQRIDGRGAAAGTADAESLLDRIHARFCLGK